MKPGDKVWVSDVSEENAIKGRTYRVYVCEYNGGHCCLAPDGNGVIWKYAVPVPELPEGYTQWAGRANFGSGDVLVDVILRDGSVETASSKALRWVWGTGKPENDIVGYRVVKDYVDHAISTENGLLLYGDYDSVHEAVTSIRFLGYVSDKGELMGMPLMWRNQFGDLRPYLPAGSRWPEVRAVAVRMKR